MTAVVRGIPAVRSPTAAFRPSFVGCPGHNGTGTTKSAGCAGAVGQVARLITGFEIVVNGIAVPAWVSFPGALIAALLTVWMVIAARPSQAGRRLGYAGTFGTTGNAGEFLCPWILE